MKVVSNPKTVPPESKTLSTTTLPTLVADDEITFRKAIYLMVLSFGRLQACREAFGRDIELTGSQFVILVGTSHMQGVKGVSIRTLAEHVHLAANHVTTEVNRLIGFGLLKKRLNQEDRRGVLVSLSANGRMRLKKLEPFLQTINDLLFQGITREELDQLTAILTKFVRNSEFALAAIRAHETRDVPEA